MEALTVVFTDGKYAKAFRFTGREWLRWTLKLPD